MNNPQLRHWLGLRSLLSIPILRRCHSSFALEESGEGALFVETEGKGDIADEVGAATQQHLGLQDESAVEPLHHRLAAVFLDDCRQAVGRETELVGVEGYGVFSGAVSVQ